MRRGRRRRRRIHTVNSLPSKQVKEEESLLQVPYTTLFDFAHLLRELSLSLGPLASCALLYHSAAVSDFFIHPSDMAEHKIQSSGKLELVFQNTPKLLIPLREKWAPHAFTVTFKVGSQLWANLLASVHSLLPPFFSLLLPPFSPSIPHVLS